jgi:hypothetical protein
LFVLCCSLHRRPPRGEMHLLFALSLSILPLDVYGACYGRLRC